ncbi:MAG: DUF4365 domain-containing protein [Bifidobacterium longum]|uniref:DUF4365 domain-containing protein n=2 Tax=Bifidobacterium longum TaxID=216816 RepID=A0A564RW71_BIFLI|nr:DUF4365 domain-containing protein [Bifidobacterium longum]VUW82436.1 Uncharacterised protein [Bifidobacterium longum subsp. infantis]
MSIDEENLDSSSLGAAGESAVSYVFTRFGWSVSKPNPDRGTDLEVTPGDRHFPLGVQVKTGKSFFQKREVDEDGQLIGWWYRSSNKKHRLQWTTGAPVLLVLFDDKQEVGYWTYVSESEISDAGSSWRILVPIEQVLDKFHLSAIQQILDDYYKRLPVTETSWSNNLKDIPKEDRMRYALLTPRIIAPHPNNYRDLSGIEILAVHVLMRDELDRAWFRDEDQEAPQNRLFPIEKSFLQASESDEWSWNAAAAVHKYLCRNDSSLIMGLFDKAQAQYEKVAAAILASVVCTDNDDLKKAHDWICCARSTHNTKMDEAWLDVQEARIYLSMGDYESRVEASHKAYAAYIFVKTVKSDRTAEALLASCSRLLWQTNNPLFIPDEDRQQYIEKNPANSLMLEDHINAIDNAPQWWQGEYIGSALSKQVDFEFKGGAKNQGSPVNVDMKRKLVSAAFIASCAGNLVDWQQAWRLMAITDYSAALKNRDESLMLSSLGLLRSFGRMNEMKNATIKALHICSGQSFAEDADSIDLSKVLETDLNNTLDYLCSIAAATHQETAKRNVTWCKRWIDDTQILSAKSGDFSRGQRVIRLLFASCPAAGEEAMRETALWAYSQPAVTNNVVAGPFAYGVRSLPSTVWKTIAEKRNLANDVSPVQEAFAAVTDIQADAKHSHLMNGEIDYLADLDLEHKLSEDEACAVTKKLTASVSETIAMAKKGVHARGGLQVEVALFLIGRLHPSLRNDSLLMDFLDEQTLFHDEKEPLLNALFWRNDLLLDEDRQEWVKHINPLAEVPPTKDGFFGAQEDIRPTAMKALAANVGKEKRSELIDQMLLRGEEFTNSAFDVLSLFPDPRYITFALFTVTNSVEDALLSACRFLTVCAYQGLCNSQTAEHITTLARDGSYKVQCMICSTICGQLETNAVQGNYAKKLIAIAENCPSASLRWRLSHVGE